MPRWRRRDSGGWAAAGAGYLARSAGKFCFEVEVLKAQGEALIGVAGTNFRGTAVGGGEATSEASWGVYTDGRLRHRQASVCVSDTRVASIIYPRVRAPIGSPSPTHSDRPSEPPHPGNSLACRLPCTSCNT
jgi:hypothetical protein